MPEHAQITALTAEVDKVSQDLIKARTAVSDLELEQSKAEADLEPVRERLVRNQRRIADGTVPDPKALNGLVEEVEHLKRRIATLEEAELDVMERLEDVQSVRDRLTVHSTKLDGQLAELVGARNEKIAAIDAEAQKVKTERSHVAGEVAANLLAVYDKVRAGHGGVGAAELKHRRCSGCQLELNPTDLRTYAAAPADEVLRCEECSRILVRTADSGL